MAPESRRLLLRRSHTQPPRGHRQQRPKLAAHGCCRLSTALILCRGSAQCRTARRALAHALPMAGLMAARTGHNVLCRLCCTLRTFPRPHTRARSHSSDDASLRHRAFSLGSVLSFLFFYPARLTHSTAAAQEERIPAPHAARRTAGPLLAAAWGGAVRHSGNGGAVDSCACPEAVTGTCAISPARVGAPFCRTEAR
jgi:hypothetical protein